MNEFTFHNVTVTVTAETAKDAYTILCDALGTSELTEWETDTYTTDSAPDVHRDTAECWPDDDSDDDGTGLDDAGRDSDGNTREYL